MSESLPTQSLPPFHIQYGATFSIEANCWYAVTELVVADHPPEQQVIWSEMTFDTKELALGFAEQLANLQANHIQKDLAKWLEKKVAQT